MNAFFCICATKINLVFLLIFAGAGMGFTLLGSALWALAEGALVAGDKLLVVSLSVIHFIRFFSFFFNMLRAVVRRGSSLPCWDGICC